MRIYIDLDGTILEPRRRIWSLFFELTHPRYIEYKYFWRLKRNGWSNERLLREIEQWSPENFMNFHHEWMARIESTEMLALDRPFGYAKESLRCLSGKAELFLLTHRQRPNGVKEQLDRWDLRQYFKEILLTEGTKPKESLISRDEEPFHALIVGDTGEDVRAGKSVNICTVAVWRGIRSAATLRQYNPDHLLPHIGYVKYLLDQKTPYINISNEG